MKRVIAGILMLAWVPPMLAAPHTLEELYRPASIHTVRLSPDGKRVAMGITVTKDRRDSIGVVDVERMAEPDTIRRIELVNDANGTRVSNIHWVSNTRIFVDLSFEYSEPRPGSEPGDESAKFISFDKRYSFDAVGNAPVVTYPGRTPVNLILDDTPGDPDTVITQGADDGGVLNLYRVRVDSPAHELVEKGDRATTSFRVRDGRAVLKFDHIADRSIVSVFGRDPNPGAEWVYLSQYRYPKDRWLSEQIVGAGPGYTEVYLRTRPEGADTEAILLYDYKLRAVKTTVAAVPDRDIEGVVQSRNQFVAARYYDDRINYVFADPVLQRHYAGLRKYFGADANVSLLGMDESRQRWLLYVSGSQTPAEYHVYDLVRRDARLLQAVQPWLDPSRLAPAAVRTVTTRDRATITAYATCPQSASTAPAPLIVMPPEGPWTRAAALYDSLVQAFAAQGWCVLQPNTRGVYGYGQAFQEAGLGQWSGRVVQDVLDAIDDVVKAGLADRKRIALHGHSLGAYVALSAAIDNPGLFRAVVASSGIYDLGSILRENDSYSNDAQRWEKWLGTINRDVSPIARAGAIRVPVLLIDRPRNPAAKPGQTESLQKALQKAGNAPRVLLLTRSAALDSTLKNNMQHAEEAIAFLRPLLQ